MVRIGEHAACSSRSAARATGADSRRSTPRHQACGDARPGDRRDAVQVRRIPEVWGQDGAAHDFSRNNSASSDSIQRSSRVVASSPKGFRTIRGAAGCRVSEPRARATRVPAGGRAPSHRRGLDVPPPEAGRSMHRHRGFPSDSEAFPPRWSGSLEIGRGSACPRFGGIARVPCQSPSRSQGSAIGRRDRSIRLGPGDLVVGTLPNPWAARAPAGADPAEGGTGGRESGSTRWDPPIRRVVAADREG